MSTDQLPVAMDDGAEADNGSSAGTTTVAGGGAGGAAVGDQGLGRLIAHWGERLALPAAWLCLIVVFSILKTETFVSQGNLRIILGQQAVLFMLALAALLPSMVGDIDLSLGWTAALAAMTLGVLNVRHDWPIGWAVLVAVGVGLSCGAVNAFLIVRLNTPPFIITLGTMSFFTGLVYWISRATTITGVDRVVSRWTYGQRYLTVPVQFYYCVAVMLVIWWVARFTPLGVRALFVGQSRDVARLSGINSNRIRAGAFILAGLIASLAGLFHVGNTGAAGPTGVDAFLLPAYAAVFLGATTIQPGRFNPLGTGIAVLFLATGVSGLRLYGAAAWVQELFYGGTLVIAVVFARYLRRQPS